MFGGRYQPHADESVGDDDEGWAVDGLKQRKRFDVQEDPEGHAGRGGEPWACAWRQGDVVGLAANLTTGEIAASLNGSWSSAGCGVVFDISSRAGAAPTLLYPALSANGVTLAYNLDGGAGAGGGCGPWRHGPPPPGLWKGGAAAEAPQTRGGTFTTEQLAKLRAMTKARREKEAAAAAAGGAAAGGAAAGGGLLCAECDGSAAPRASSPSRTGCPICGTSCQTSVPADAFASVPAPRSAPPAPPAPAPAPARKAKKKKKQKQQQQPPPQ